jgi:hypothetical protein
VDQRGQLQPLRLMPPTDDLVGSHEVVKQAPSTAVIVSSGTRGPEERDDPFDFVIKGLLFVPTPGSRPRACRVFAQAFQPTGGGWLSAQADGGDAGSRPGQDTMPGEQR